MAQLIVVFWRDIPAQVIVKAGRQTAKRELPERFVQAIDMPPPCAPARRPPTTIWRTGGVRTPCPAGTTWKPRPTPRSARLVAEYDKARILELVNNQGRAAG